MPSKHSLTQEENAQLIERYTRLAKNLLRNKPGKFGRYRFISPEDRLQIAMLGILEAGADHGKDATPLQVKDGIRAVFLRALRLHQKNIPREPCLVCGSAGLKLCPHKKRAIKEGSYENGFANKNSKLVSVDDDECYQKEIEAIGADTSDKETEIWLAAVQLAANDMPENLRNVYQKNFVEGKSVATISTEIDLTKKVVERLLNESKAHLREHAPDFETVARNNYEESCRSRPKVVPYPEPPAPRPLLGLSKLTTCMYCHSSEHLSDGHRSPIEKKKQPKTRKARKRVVKEIPAYQHEESHEELGVLCGVGEDA